MTFFEMILKNGKEREREIKQQEKKWEQKEEEEAATDGRRACRAKREAN